MVEFGKGALMAKIDIESAYRLVPVHPHDRPLQAMEWQGNLYVDPMLLFGLRSAPKIFNAVADGLEWYVRWCGVRHIFHYLDDFIVIGPPDSPICASAMETLDRSCAALGIPIAEGWAHPLHNISRHRNRHAGLPTSPSHGQAAALAGIAGGMGR